VRIAIDVTPLSHPRTGIGNYVRGLVAGLVEASAGAHELVCFGPVRPRGAPYVREALAGLDVELRLWRVRGSHWVRQGWSRLRWPPAERLLGPLDVLHFSDWMYPPQRRGVRATTVHDLVPLHSPQWATPRTVQMHTAKYAHAARTCHVLFANSEATARDVRARLGVAPERVRVAYPGIDPRFSPSGPVADLGAPYLLAVGTNEPRKGLDDLLRAFAVVRARHPDALLALAGAEGWGERPEVVAAGVRALGFVTDDELARLYRGAAALAFPSRFEGFGIPVVEALASGTLVVASDHPSLDEACGGACVRVDTADTAAFAGALEDALGGRAPRTADGLAHAARFTWRACGETHLAGYAEAARRAGGV
jgi:glycosyltransferase involved in cell wall biosynthesis